MKIVGKVFWKKVKFARNDLFEQFFEKRSFKKKRPLNIISHCLIEIVMIRKKFFVLVKYQGLPNHFTEMSHFKRLSSGEC